MIVQEIPIVVQEKAFLVANKPAGLFTQAAAGIRSLETELREQLRNEQTGGGEKLSNPFIGLPHRLDKGTSGVLLVARNQRSLKRFGQQFQARKVQKFYLAVVEGDASGVSGTLIDFVRKVPDEARAEILVNPEEGREARLDAHCLGVKGGQSLILVQLHTGRMHQIRVQLASRGFPVWGDSLYGGKEAYAPAQHFVVPAAKDSQPVDSPTVAYLPLHATRLDFFHPMTAKAVRAVAHLPDSWREFSMFEEARGAVKQLEGVADLAEAIRNASWKT